MRWRSRSAPSRAKERANISFFIFIMFFAVFGVIVLTELLLLERPPVASARSRFSDDVQGWEAKGDAGGDGTDPPPPAHAPLDAVWQPVAGTRFKFFVYSAYVERRTIAAVRVIAATKTRGADSVVCRLWLLDNRTLTVKARVKPIRENWNLKYSATYVLCSLRDTGVKPQDTAGASVAVMASTATHRPPTNLLPVLDTTPKSGIEENLHVCVKPIHYSYARDDWLVEWFELNRLLGASHFYMYNDSLSAPVACLLEQYRREGLITLLQWKLPLISKLEIRTEGQFAAFNDCLYRSMSSAGWLLVIDLDEVVLPRRERTLPALLTSLRASYNTPSKAPSAFMFRNAFFYLRWEDDADAPAPLLTSRKTRRWAAPHALKHRSKYAVRPSDAVELGNHFLWEMAPGASAVGVATDRALLHHYRVNGELLKYKLNDGNEIPAVALGTSLGHLADGTRVLPTNHSLARAVQWALEAGYRHIDTATLYRVEDEVGLGVRYFLDNTDNTRADVYVTTKLWNDAHERNEVIPALKKSLELLQMDFIDLYLVHYPMAYKKDGSISLTDYLETWKGMEDAKEMNLTRSIGVSNFNLTQLQRLWDNARIKPAVLQIEVNPTITQTELITWCRAHDVIVMAYSPFGAILGRKPSAPPPRADHPTLKRLAEKYNKTVPQILIRYLIDQGLVAIPRSTNKERIQQNIDISDFTLSPQEIAELSTFNKDYRLRTPAKWYPHPEFPFEKKNLTDAEIQYIIEHSKED